MGGHRFLIFRNPPLSFPSSALASLFSSSSSSSFGGDPWLVACWFAGSRGAQSIIYSFV
jgi:hypothetical protein